MAGANLTTAPVRSVGKLPRASPNALSFENYRRREEKKGNYYD